MREDYIYERRIYSFFFLHTHTHARVSPAQRQQRRNPSAARIYCTQIQIEGRGLLPNSDNYQQRRWSLIERFITHVQGSPLPFIIAPWIDPGGVIQAESDVLLETNTIL